MPSPAALASVLTVVIAARGSSLQVNRLYSAALDTVTTRNSGPDTPEPGRRISREAEDSMVDRLYRQALETRRTRSLGAADHRAMASLGGSPVQRGGGSGGPPPSSPLAAVRCAPQCAASASSAAPGVPFKKKKNRVCCEHCGWAA